MDLGIWITAFAILLAPFIALQVSVLLEKQREKRKRRLTIFQILMSTRASTLAPDHVQALNMIDVEFYGKDKNSKDVITAWEVYAAHLHDKSFTLDVWASKRHDLFVELLLKIAVSLGYDFDKASIKRTSYIPQGYEQMEMDRLTVQKGLAAVFSGKSGLPVEIISDADKEQQEKWLRIIEDHLTHKLPIKVIVWKEEGTQESGQDEAV